MDMTTQSCLMIKNGNSLKISHSEIKYKTKLFTHANGIEQDSANLYLTFFILDITQNMISTGVSKPQSCERKPTYQQTAQMHMWKTYYTSSLFLSTAACREGEDTKG